MPFTFFLAKRYSFPFLSKGLSRFLSVVSILGLVLSISSLIIVTSVMNGFGHELKSRMLALMPAAEIIKKNNEVDINWPSLANALLQDKAIQSASLFIEGSAMVIGTNNLASVTLLGIENISQSHLKALDQHMLAGNSNRLMHQSYSVIIGSQLAREMNLLLGDSINILTSRIQVTPFGAKTREKRFKVVGIFEVGADVDKTIVITDRESAKKLFAKKNNADGLQIGVEDIYQSNEMVKNALGKQSLIPQQSLTVVNWQQKNQTFFNAIMMEKFMIFILLLAVVAVASFNVVSIILMGVTDKKSDIAVLRTMGVSASRIRNIFILQGFLIGATGTLIGTLLGLSIAPRIGDLLESFERTTGWQLFDPNVYYIAYLPSKVIMNDVYMVILISLSISILVSLYPAIRASKIPPAIVLAEKT